MSLCASVSSCVCVQVKPFVKDIWIVYEDCARGSLHGYLLVRQQTSSLCTSLQSHNVIQEECHVGSNVLSKSDKVGMTKLLQFGVRLYSYLKDGWCFSRPTFSKETVKTMLENLNHQLIDLFHSWVLGFHF